MPDAATDKPVFIDQMPEYQQAVRQIIAMPKEGGQIQKLTEDLGVAGDFFKANVTALDLEDKARVLSQTQRTLNERAVQFEKHDRNLDRDALLAGSAITIGGALTAGIAASRRRISGLKALVIGAGAGLIGTLVSLNGDLMGRVFAADGKKLDTLKPDFAQLNQAKQQLVKQQLELTTGMLNKIATAMLEQQKMLVGEGADMKLVSNAQAAAEISQPAQSMADKYAVPPAATHTDAAVASQGTAAQQR